MTTVLVEITMKPVSLSSPTQLSPFYELCDILKVFMMGIVQSGDWKGTTTYSSCHYTITIYTLHKLSFTGKYLAMKSVGVWVLECCLQKLVFI